MPPFNKKKTKQIMIRISDEELEFIKSICAKKNISVSKYIRNSVRRISDILRDKM